MPSPPQVSPAPKRAMLLLSFILVVGGYMGWLYVSEKRENKTQLTSESKLAQAEIQESEKDESFFDISEPEVEDPFAFEDHPVDKKTAEAQKKRAIQIETSLQPDQNEAQVKNNQQTQTEGESGVEHANSDIVILVSQRSWIEIKDAESKILYRGILKEGETYPIPKGEGMIFTTGNAGGISFSIDGKKTPIMGRSGQVIRRVPLTKESLSAVGRPNESQRQATTGDDARATTRERNEGPTTRGITSTYPGY